MKGATSCGPSACVTISATASTAACATTFSREKAARIVRGTARRQVLRADADRDGQQHRPVTSGEASPQRVKSPVIICQATSKVSDRKKIQAKQTTWKVASRRQ